jgi:hypothetical protein
LDVFRADGAETKAIVSVNVSENQQSQVELPDGDYVFDATGVGSNWLVALRARVSVAGAETSVEFVGKEIACNFVGQSEDAIPAQLSIRKFGDGEIRWIRPSGENDSPRLYLTSKKDYLAHFVSDTQKATIAASLKFNCGESVKFAEPKTVRNVRFSLAAGMLTPQSISAIVELPSCKFKVADALRRSLLLGYRDAIVGAEVTTKSGQRLVFDGVGESFGLRENVSLAGAPKVVAFAYMAWQETGSKWVPVLLTSLDLTTQSGSLVNKDSSDLKLKCEWKYRDKNNAIQSLIPEKAGDLAVDPKRIFVEGEYLLDGKRQRFNVDAEGFIQLKRGRISIECPSAWIWRGKSFIDCVENIRRLVAKNTSRPGPNSFDIDWQLNEHNAKANVGNEHGGQENVRMWFPYWTFQTFSDPFVEPWFGRRDPYVAHEMLHTFGYNHGPELSGLEWKTESEYVSYRWIALDRGEWILSDESPQKR